jgi:hypothetical protein
MNKFADLEIGLHRREANTYAVDFRFNQPESETDIRLTQGVAKFDIEALGALPSGSPEYGRALSESLFADADVQTAFAQAFTSAQTQDVSLRLRLLIGPSAPELHSLHWETLVNPSDGTPLATNENLLLSRYLSSLDWRPVRLRPKEDLSALVVIANPTNLSDYNLASIDVGSELKRAQDGLGSIPQCTLPDERGEQRATLAGLFEHLRLADQDDNENCFDIIYLVCHGVVVQGEPWLWMEDEEGKAARTSGTELVTRLKELDQRPRLIVLASCESAGDGTGEALSALGPRLAEAGIPAVLAMQGKISLETIAQFMPTFFENLQLNGEVDRAVTVARGAVRERPDHWMPTLFMRLKSGRIWYVPGFGGERKDFEKWPALLRSIRKGQCTPILGPGLYEKIVGSPRRIAQRWAEAYHYPMAPHERESLPQVAQYLTINQYDRAPYDELEEYLERETQRRHKGILPPELQSGRASLDEIIEAVGAQYRQRYPWEPHKALAQLDLPLYITTNVDNMMAAALEEAGKDPQVMLCPWNEYVEQVESIYDREPDYFPTTERPLVYHLFGQLEEPDSVVLTEDDYFEFLIGITSNKDLIPSVVRRAWADTALLFLGFQMDDWNFRVLFRSILSQQGGGRRGRYAHIAAQIEPEEGRILEPDRARRYLENYFAKGADINLFWGSAEDFLKELLTHWNERGR